eukprot:5966991-Amphidinium_carterae.1
MPGFEMSRIMDRMSSYTTALSTLFFLGAGGRAHEDAATSHLEVQALDFSSNTKFNLAKSPIDLASTGHVLLSSLSDSNRASCGGTHSQWKVGHCHDVAVQPKPRR